MRKKLYRVVLGNERYYYLSLELTMFGDFCLERIFGASKNKKPTRVIKEYFVNKQLAEEKYFAVIKSKIAKGYISL